jgi:hypothetical protein
MPGMLKIWGDGADGRHDTVPREITARSILFLVRFVHGLALIAIRPSGQRYYFVYTNVPR